MQSRRQNTPSIPLSGRRPIQIARSRRKNSSSQKNIELASERSKVLHPTQQTKGDPKKVEPKKVQTKAPIFNEIIPLEQIPPGSSRRDSGLRDSHIRTSGIQVTQLGDPFSLRSSMLLNEMRMRSTQRQSIDSSRLEETGTCQRNSIRIGPDSQKSQKELNTPIDTLNSFRESLDKRQYQNRKESVYGSPRSQTIQKIRNMSNAKRQDGRNPSGIVKNVFVLPPQELPYITTPQKLPHSIRNHVYSSSKSIKFHSPHPLQQQRATSGEMQRSVERIREPSGSNRLISAVPLPPKPIQGGSIKVQYQEQPGNLGQTQRPGIQNIRFVHHEQHRTGPIFEKSPPNFINSTVQYSSVGNREELTRRNRLDSVQTIQKLHQKNQPVRRQSIHLLQKPLQRQFQPVYQQSPSQKTIPRHAFVESPWKPAQSIGLKGKQISQVSQQTCKSKVYSQKNQQNIDVKTAVTSNQSRILLGFQENTVKTTDTVMGISTLLTLRPAFTEASSSLTSSSAANKIINQSTPLKMTISPEYKQSAYQNESITREDIRQTESRLTETDITKIRLTTNYRKGDLRESSHKNIFQSQKQNDGQSFMESAKMKGDLGSKTRGNSTKKDPTASSVSYRTQVSAQTNPNISRINSQTSVKETPPSANKFRPGEEYLEKSSQGYYGDLPIRKQSSFANEYSQETSKEYLVGNLQMISQVKVANLGKKDQTLPMNEYKIQAEKKVSVEEEYGYVAPSVKNNKPTLLIDGSIIGPLQMLIDDGVSAQPQLQQESFAQKLASRDYIRYQQSPYKGSSNFRQSEVYEVFSSEYENNKMHKSPFRHQQKSRENSRQYNYGRPYDAPDIKQFHVRDAPVFDRKVSEEIVEQLRRLKSSDREDSYVVNERFKLNSKKVIDDIFDKETNKIMRSMKSIEDRNRNEY